MRSRIDCWVISKSASAYTRPTDMKSQSMGRLPKRKIYQNQKVFCYFVFVKIQEKKMEKNELFKKKILNYKILVQKGNDLPT